MRITRLVSPVLLAFALPAAPATAAEETLGTGVHRYAVVHDAGGDAAVVMQTAAGLSVNVRVAGGPWSGPETVPGAPAAQSPAAAVAAGGAIVVGWRLPGQVTGRDAIVATVRPAGGVWSAPQTVGSDGVRNVAVGMYDDGTALVAFKGGSHEPLLADQDRVMLAVRRPGATAFARARRASPDHAYGVPRLASSSAGRGLLLWRAQRGLKGRDVDGPALGRTFRLPSGMDAGPLVAAIGPDGTAVVASAHRDGGLTAVGRSAAGPFGAVATLVPGTTPSQGYTVAAGAGGDVAVTWSLGARILLAAGRAVPALPATVAVAPEFESTGPPTAAVLPGHRFATAWVRPLQPPVMALDVRGRAPGTRSRRDLPLEPPPAGRSVTLDYPDLLPGPGASALTVVRFDNGTVLAQDTTA